MLTGAVCCLLKTLRIDGPTDWRIAAWGGLRSWGVLVLGRGWEDLGGREGASEAFGGADGDLGLRFSVFARQGRSELTVSDDLGIRAL